MGNRMVDYIANCLTDVRLPPTEKLYLKRHRINTSLFFLRMVSKRLRTCFYLRNIISRSSDN